MALRSPHDLKGNDLGEYKGVRPAFDQWSHVVEVCGEVSVRLLDTCIKALRVDGSKVAQEAQGRIDTWREARAGGETPRVGKLPGLPT